MIKGAYWFYSYLTVIDRVIVTVLHGGGQGGNVKSGLVWESFTELRGCVSHFQHTRVWLQQRAEGGKK